MVGSLNPHREEVEPITPEGTMGGAWSIIYRDPLNRPEEWNR